MVWGRGAHPLPPLWETLSTVPDIQSYKTSSRLSPLNFKDDDIITLIGSLDVHKAHGHYFISIWMIKICHSAIVKLLSKILLIVELSQLSRRNLIFNIFIKNDKQIMNNNRPVLLLLIFQKIYEKLIFKSLFEYLEEQKLLSVNGFRANASCTN